MLTFKDRIDKNTLGLIQRTLIPKYSPIIFDLELEGQKINDKKQFAIGPWAGPVAEISHLLHQCSHFAEREIEKLKLFPYSSWGFSFGKYWEIGSHSGYEPSTDQAVRREQRVWAYQLSIQRHFNIQSIQEDESNKEDESVNLVMSVKYISAWCFYQPFAQITHDDTSRILHMAKETDIMSRNEYTYEAFMNAWNTRIDELRNITNTESVVCMG